MGLIRGVLSLFFFPFRLLALVLVLFTFSPWRIRRQWASVGRAFASQNFIRILSNIAMLGVGVGAAALVIILSVFNGLEDITKSMYKMYNPELKIEAVRGKSFPADSLFLARLKALPGVVSLTEVVEDNVLLRYQDRQKVVRMKGVSLNYLSQYKFDTAVVYGSAQLLSERGEPMALMGAGVQYELGVSLKDEFTPLQVWYPVRDRQFSLNPEKAFVRNAIRPGGIFMIEQLYDQGNIIVPIAFAQDLLRYDGRRTSVELKAEPGKVRAVQKSAKALLGEGFSVKTLEEQQENILRAVKIERLFVFITFTFILAIAAFNVFFALAMLAIEKKKDIAILRAMGAGSGQIRRLFLYEGGLIAFTGAALGLLVGGLVCLLQQQFGIVKLGVISSVVQAYPVSIKWEDFAITALIVIAVTLVASFVPARNAAALQIRDHL